MSAALAPIPAASSGALRAELQKTQKDLSNRVNCDSAKTASGQSKIATLRAQVQGIEQRIEKARQTEAPAADATAAPPPPSPSPLGNFLDVYG